MAPVALNPLLVDATNPVVFTIWDNDLVVALAAVPDDSEPEIAILVDPRYRRQGLGTALHDACRRELTRRGTLFALYVADLSSPSAEPFLAAIGALATFAEYRMVWQAIGLPEAAADLPRLVIRPADRADEIALIQVQMWAFDRPLEAATEHIDAGLQESGRHFVLAEVDGEAVGMVRRGVWDGVGDITSLGVIPEWRGKGIGRALLLDATRYLHQEGFTEIALEVATDNASALGLYQSVGYQITTQYGYFTVPTD